MNSTVSSETDSPNVMIGTRRIGPDHPPFIIAEMSGNHDGSLEKALQLVEAAAAAGAHALKLQTYTAADMTLDIRENEFIISDPDSLWSGRSLYQLYQEAHTPYAWHRPLFERCRQLGMLCFSTPFTPAAVDFLEELEVPAYKVASFENTDLELIKKIAATGKPMIISTGMATLAELDETVGWARQAGARELILLKCTSTYPADPGDSHLKTIPHLRQLFNCEVGLSDHTPGLGAALAAIALGASVIETHFPLPRAAGGVDAAFSLEPDELRKLVSESERAWRALGRIHYGPGAKEKKSLVFIRSLYITEDLKAGDRLTPENLRAIRPGLGLPPKYYHVLLGKQVNRDIRRGTPASWEIVG